MYEVLAALGPELRRFASAAAEAHVAGNPRGFPLYSIPLGEEALRALVAEFDVDDWDFLREEVGGLAVAHLRSMFAAGRIAAVTSGPNAPEWREAARDSEHPLLQIMADGEFAGALPGEVQAALRQAADLPGWNVERPAIVPSVI